MKERERKGERGKRTKDAKQNRRKGSSHFGDVRDGQLALLLWACDAENFTSGSAGRRRMLTSSRLWAKQTTGFGPSPSRTYYHPSSFYQAPLFQGSTTSQKCHLLATMASTCDLGRAFLIQGIAAMDAALGSQPSALLKSPVSASVHSPPVFSHMPGPGWACVLVLSPPTALSTVGGWAWDPGTVVPTLIVVPDLAIFPSQLLSKSHHGLCHGTHHSPLPSPCQDLSQTPSRPPPRDLLEPPLQPLLEPVRH